MKVELPDTIEGCHSLIEQLFLIIEKQQEEIDLLKQEISELKERLNQNSRNSNRPPSGDGFQKPHPKPAFKKKKKNKGGQRGHSGNTLKQVSEPDVVVDCEPLVCQCGTGEWTLEVEIAETRQVFELPEPRLEVIEYRCLKRRCQCGKISCGEFPAEVVARVQYGVRVQAMVSLLSISGCLSFGKIGELFGDLFGYELNTATAQTMIQRTSALMPVQAIKNEVIKSEVVNADETGIKENDVLKWLHTASSKNLTYQYAHPKRGKEAMRDEKSILPWFKGVLVHDCWESYFSFSQIRHAICNAHILRELTGLIENQQSVWGKKMKELLMQMYLASDYGKGVIGEIGTYQDRYQTILELGEVEEPPAEKVNPKGKLKRSKGRNLLERLKKHKEAVFRFATLAEVPFTNNQAERDIRQVKVKQRVSSGFRAESGSESFCRIHSLISTLRKQGRKVFEELQAIIEGKPFEVFQT